MNLTFDEMVQACKNIGYDLRCGACAELFYTGVRLNPHDEICTTVKENAPPVTASNHHPVIVSATATTPATGEDRWVGLYASLLSTSAHIEKEQNELLVQVAADRERLKKAEYDRDVARGMVGAVAEGSDSWKADFEAERTARTQVEANAAVMREVLQSIASWDPPGDDNAANWLSRTAKRGLASDAGESLLAEVARLREEIRHKDTEIESLRECDTCDGGGTFYLDDEPQDCVCMEPFADKLAKMRAETGLLRVLLQEARDNALASTAETGVSDARLEYRRALVARLDEALADKHGKSAAEYVRMMEGMLSYVYMTHPLPWKIDQDWSTEVRDSKDDIIASYQTVKEAQLLIDAGVRLGKAAEVRRELVEELLRADAEGNGKS